MPGNLPFCHYSVQQVVSVPSSATFRVPMFFPPAFYIKECMESFQNIKTGKRKKIRKRKKGVRERGSEGGEGFHSCC